VITDWLDLAFKLLTVWANLIPASAGMVLSSLPLRRREDDYTTTKSLLISLFQRERRERGWVPAGAGMAVFLLSFHQFNQDVLRGGGVDKDDFGAGELHRLFILEFLTLRFKRFDFFHNIVGKE